MKQSYFIPQDQTYWYLNHSICKPLAKDITTDVVVIGGGMAGLSAAQAFRDKGFSVVILEKNFCGSGASGKSSGFITPNSELSLYTLIDEYGPVEAKKLWDFASSGVEYIRSNIKKYNLACDYQEQDTLVLASTAKAYTSEILKEYEARKQSGYISKVYDVQNTSSIVGSHAYYGALSYPGSFSMRGFAYCQGLKENLIQDGVQVYEETPVLAVEDKLIKTRYHTVKADRIIVCMDQFARHIPTLRDKVYHVQTFLTASAPLTQEQVRSLFPDHSYMTWDTDLIYHYFRLTADNRLLVGGAQLFDTYASEETHNNKRVVRMLERYIATKFPQLNASFEYIWPGLIGVSKDLFPIAGFDENNSSIYYITAATGLPWAAALGNYAVRHCVENDTTFANYFSPYRAFKIGSWATKLFGKKLSFALSHFLTSSSF